MKVDRELVLHIASLARVELSESEIQTFTVQLGTILEYIEKLNEVQESAEPFSFGEFLQHSLRPDEPCPSLSVEEALKNAPDRKNNLLRVPRIIP
jgi:aspartyl-tRNA(Asn)/glutamyl-tRNA(Gln) amidotransferase subunit C